MANSQHRCVFVGNIPYDATEEQLVQICEEVGPVVSFRLVIDRETGKPKGYGFCEYKDEETALSARRNLQGYEINGRQLRVDFAENDKGADRNREQGRGGPGMVANVDGQKQVGGSAVPGDSTVTPIGLPLAMAAASVMAGALGGSQTGSQLNHNGLHNRLGVGTDTLTLHLAKMSRSQLNEIMFELKGLATQNKELARQLLLANPLLRKALFQSQIMLRMVPPQMLQMPNIRQASGPFSQHLLHDGQLVQPSSVQTLPGLPPLAQNKMQFGMRPKAQESQMPAVSQNSSVNLFSALPQAPSQPQVHLPQLVQNQVLQQAALPGKSGVSTLHSIHPQPLGNLSVRPQLQIGNSSLKLQMQPHSLQHPLQVGAAKIGHNNQLAISDATLQSFSIRPPLSETGFQPGSSTLSSISVAVNKNVDRSAQVADDATWVGTTNTYSHLPLEGMGRQTSEPMNRPSKLLKLDDGRSSSSSVAGLPMPAGSSPSQTLGAGSLPANQIPKADEVPPAEKLVPQSQLPPEVESALLQQVMNLTPEQLSSLPPEQQQQVIQLQQMLR